MALQTKLGSIKSARFGYGGYDDAMFGLSLEFGGESWGCGTFEGGWAHRPDYVTWTAEDQRKNFADAVEILRDTLKAAKKTDVAKLAGTPVEVTFDGLKLSSWRVLTEVIT